MYWALNKYMLKNVAKFKQRVYFLILDLFTNLDIVRFVKIEGGKNDITVLAERLKDVKNYVNVHV